MNLCIFNNGASREEVNIGATALNMHSSWMESFYDYYIAGLHKLWYPGIRDMSTWSKFRAHGEHGDVFLFSNLGAL